MLARVALEREGRVRDQIWLCFDGWVTGCQQNSVVVRKNLLSSPANEAVPEHHIYSIFKFPILIFWIKKRQKTTDKHRSRELALDIEDDQTEEAERESGILNEDIKQHFGAQHRWTSPFECLVSSVTTSFARWNIVPRLYQRQLHQHVLCAPNSAMTFSFGRYCITHF